jgi:hypothetical protein
LRRPDVGLDPQIDLGAVKDDMNNSQTGFSFIQHPENGLATVYVDLSIKACTTRRNGLFRENRWDWKAIARYEKKAVALEEMLLGGLYTAFRVAINPIQSTNALSGMDMEISQQ